LEDVPAFWTREQRGEEASTWLLFTHKHLYLSRTAALFRSAGTAPTRSFCVPRESVTASGRPERVLLLLSAALMECSGIRVEVCAEPEYSAIQGFALDQRRRAIVANWVGGDGIWQVDVTGHRPLLREFADAQGYATADSVIAGPTPAARLRAFADDLDLDWNWLTRRCAELGDTGPPVSPVPAAGCCPPPRWTGLAFRRRSRLARCPAVGCRSLSARDQGASGWQQPSLRVGASS
jgi:hypothetical protein